MDKARTKSSFLDVKSGKIACNNKNLHWSNPMKDHILTQYEIRKSNPEKTRFIEYLKARLAEAGYDPEKDITIEEKGKGHFLSRNIVVGNPKTAKLLIGAHYDTCAMLPFPNFMAPTNPVLFILSQIMLLILMFAMALLVGVIAMFITQDGVIAYVACLVFLYALMFHMLFGYRNSHTANDNTSGTIAITRILEALPEEARDKVCVIYFDNEEKVCCDLPDLHFNENYLVNVSIIFV